MYVSPNFKTKKAFKEAFLRGDKITVWSPGFFDAPLNGSCCIEGPHYPSPHTWFASIEVSNGLVSKIKG